MLRALRAPLAALIATTLAATGCAALGPGPSSTMAAVDLDSPQMRQFAVANMTALERDVRIESSDRETNPKLTPALFWTGIILGSVGAAGGFAFGIAGYTTKNKLADGYESGELTLDERDQLVDRGEAFNSTAIAMTVAAVIGYATALVAYGVDWNRCGPLVRKNEKRRCDRVLGE